MPLLYGHHPNIEAAALSVANNRATKAARLRREGYPEIADRYARNLFYDVREFIGTHPDLSDDYCAALHRIVESAR